MKKHFLTGLALLMPLVLTLMIVIFLFQLFTTPFIAPVQALLTWAQEKFSIPLPPGSHLLFVRLIALFLLILLVFLLGIFARHVLLKHLIQWGHQLVYRIPLIRGIYKMSRDVFSALFSPDGKKAFHEPVLLPFPGKPNFCMGFRVGEVAKECQEQATQPLATVFAPTAPHPISGFILFIPQKDLLPLSITNEEAVKFIVSCGMILPERL